MTKIHLHIEQLSLPGYTPAERRAFIAALERELAMRTPGDPAMTSHAVLRINAQNLRPELLAEKTVQGFAGNASTSLNSGKTGRRQP